MSKDKPDQKTQIVELRGAPSGLTLTPQYKNRARFTSISLIRTFNSRNPEPDLLDLLGELSKAARDLFLDIKRNMDYRTHTASLPNHGLSRSQINNRSHAIKELERAGKGLACRVPTKGITNQAGVEQRYRPSIFMLSPKYIYPGRNYSEEIVNIWEQSIGRSKARSDKGRPPHPHIGTAPPNKTSAAQIGDESPEAGDNPRHPGKTLDFRKLDR